MICIPAQAGDWQQAHEPEPRLSLAVRTGQPHQATPRTHFPDESGWHGQNLSCRKIQIAGLVPVAHPGTPGLVIQAQKPSQSPENVLNWPSA